MSAVLARLRADLQSRWWSWLALALVVGLAGAIVLTAASGARRTDTAYQRFLDHSRAEDVFVAGPSHVNPPYGKFYAELERLPQVVAASPVGAMVLLDSERSRVKLRAGLEDAVGPYHFAGFDDRYGTTIDRPNVIAGRRPRPDRPGEILINRTMARAASLRIGSTLNLETFTTDQLSSGTVGGKKVKPTPVRLRVVGIGVYPNEVVPTAPYDSLGFMYLTPAYYRTHAMNTQGYGFEVIRLRRSQADVADFRAGMDKLLRKDGISKENLIFADRADRNASVQRAIAPQAVALWIFAAVAGAASLLVIGQVFARRTFLDANDNATLHALGMTSRQLVIVALVKVTAISFAGGLIAVVGAALMSATMPIGPARLAEPHPGIAVNVAILAGGLCATVVSLAMVAAVPAWRAARVRPGISGIGRDCIQRRSRLLELLASARVPVTAVLGLGAALQSGRGRTSVPVRSTLVISGLAIAMVVTAFTFTSNLDRLVHTPHEYGWDWDLKVGNGFFPAELGQATDLLRADPDVEAVAGVNYGDLRISGGSVPAMGIESVRGSIFPRLLEGSQVHADDEIVLGSRTLRRIHRGVGDAVSVSLGGPPKSMRIVGRAVFPKLGQGNFPPTNLGEGAAVRAHYFADGPKPNERYKVFLLRLRPGSDVAAAQTHLNRSFVPLDICGGDTGCVKLADPPGDISNYGRIRGTTLALAGALAVMAIGALGHGLITSVRRRRRDLALLKTIGFTRRQVSNTTVWQATVTALVALVIGMPIGVGLGRVIWRTFANELGVEPSPSTPAIALLLAVPATIVLANLIAAVPAMIAARTVPAAVLRSE